MSISLTGASSQPWREAEPATSTAARLCIHVACDEGRISVTYSGSGAASYRDDWHVRDYLGNTRLVVNITSASTPPSTGILEKSDYLPFGTRVATSSTPLNRWRQSGKEEQVIGGNDLGVLDFGARHYDPWLARWTTQDPMAIYQHSFSPYSYCYDNPVVIVDRDGNIGETPWDLLNVAMDAKSLVSNIKNRKVGAALLDAGGLVYDVAAAALPIIPGGAGTIIKTARGADKATDAIKVTDKITTAIGTVNDSKYSRNAVSRVINGETKYTKYGRQAHKNYMPGKDHEKEFRLPSGKKADAVSLERGDVRELKPDNPRAIKKGEKQVKEYVKELEKIHPDKKWEWHVDTYKRDL